MFQFVTDLLSSIAKREEFVESTVNIIRSAILRKVFNVSVDFLTLTARTEPTAACLDCILTDYKLWNNGLNRDSGVMSRGPIRTHKHV